MHAQHAPFGQALGTRELDVVHGQGLARGRPRDADDHRALGDGDGGGRQGQAQPPIERQHAELQRADTDRLSASARGHPTEDHGEHHDEHQADPEVGQRKAQHGTRHDRARTDSLGLETRQDAQRHADQNR
ncbi:hypothetical protein D3C86_1594670 [compost metagenome]